MRISTAGRRIQVWVGIIRHTLPGAMMAAAQREPEMLTFLELNRDNSPDVLHVNMSAVAHFSRRGNTTVIEFLSEKVAPISVRQTPEEIYDLLDKVPGNPGQQ